MKTPTHISMQCVMNENSTIVEVVQTLVNNLRKANTTIPGIHKALRALNPIFTRIESDKTPETAILLLDIFAYPQNYPKFDFNQISFAECWTYVLDIIFHEMSRIKLMVLDTPPTQSLHLAHRNLDYVYNFVHDQFLEKDPTGYAYINWLSPKKIEDKIMMKSAEVVQTEHVVVKALELVKADKIALADYHFNTGRGDSVTYLPFSVVDFYHLNLDRELMHPVLTKAIAALRSIESEAAETERAYGFLVIVQKELEAVIANQTPTL